MKQIAYRIISLLCLLGCSSAHSAVLSDGFESQNVTTVADFNIAEDGITASFSGGTAFTIGIGALYRSGVKSWMVEPAGMNARGTHPGTGTITFDTDIDSISLWVIGDSNMVSTNIMLLDENDVAVENFTPFNTLSTSWQEISFDLTMGSPPIRSVVVDVTGTGMLALDDITASFGEGSAPNPNTPNTPAPAPSGGGGGGSLSFISLLFLLALLITSRNRHPYSTTPSHNK